MSQFLDSFWRACAYCLHPRVIWLSLLPLLLIGLFSWGFAYFFWDGALAIMQRLLESFDWLNSLWSWFSLSAEKIAPLLLIITVLPAIVLLSLLIVATVMAPALTRLVGQRRFAHLERKQGASLAASLLWSFGSTGLALLALLLSLPLWLVPPLILILPPLIWGWLTYRVMAFDALADHASKEERREIFRLHRNWLLAIGIVSGYLGAAPSLVWASGVVFVAAFWILIPAAIWIYTLVFAFSSLWFAHYCLAALEKLRAEKAVPAAPSIEV